MQEAQSRQDSPPLHSLHKVAHWSVQLHAASASSIWAALLASYVEAFTVWMPSTGDQSVSGAAADTFKSGRDQQ